MFVVETDVRQDTLMNKEVKKKSEIYITIAFNVIYQISPLADTFIQSDLQI